MSKAKSTRTEGQGASAQANIASCLGPVIKERPDQAAIIFPLKKGYASWTYKQLGQTIDSYAQVLQEGGVEAGQRVLLGLKNGPDLIACVFALFKLGAVPVLLDPGMGRENLLRCIEHVEPQAFIGMRALHLYRLFHRAPFKSVLHNFTATEWFPGCINISKEAASHQGSVPVAAVRPTDMAAILFTSGSTGKAKGVVYQHRIFQEQIKYLRDLFHFKPGELDLPGYPLFGLFDLALGMTVVLPRLDPSKPAACDPALLVGSIEEFDITNGQGSPAIWRKVAQYCQDEELSLEPIERVITFGAPVGLDLLENLRSVLGEGGEVYTPYGATESLPVALVSGSFVLDHAAKRTIEGAGTCVGKPVPGMEVRIIKITDQPIEKFSEDLVLPDGEVGEIVAYGSVVTQEYYREEEANRLAKIADERGGKWHRMGDTGYFDNNRDLWFCGRKDHRVETPKGTIFPVMVEGMANNHPRVFRSALVGVGERGQQQPVLIVETKPGSLPEDEKGQEQLKRQILGRYDENELYKQIEEVLFLESFPVDPRHNVKIDRQELARWATEELQRK